VLLATRRWAPSLLGGLEPALMLQITVGSYLVALVASLPGIAVDFGRAFRSARSREGPGPVPNRFGEFVASVLIRLAGTIALFMLCRYQMPPSQDVVAAWVLGWYAWLVLVEVVSLCRAIVPMEEPTP